MKELFLAHFVGIGGIGMSALAKHMLKKGVAVSGSDRQENAQTKKLRDLGARIYTPYCAEKMGSPQMVVRTSAVPLSNEETAAAISRGIPVKLREELLGEIFNEFPTRIAVCGTHGKTTTTAMIHNILQHCGVSHAAFIGGEYKGENYFFGENVVVAEACEYNRSFLHLRPTICLCLNVEFDHPDCYENLADVEDAFKRLFCQSEKVILPSDRKNLWKNAELFGESGLCAKENCFDNRGHPHFVVCDGAKEFPCELKICGEHNISDALGALAVAKTLGLPLSQACENLADFCGVDRRWTEVEGKIHVVCDYAHHPTEIAASLKTARQTCDGKIFCVFQPHTYSRTKALLNEFTDCLLQADQVILLPVFAAREKPNQGASSAQLCELMRSRGKNVESFETFAEVASFLTESVGTNDMALLLGAGDINTLAELLR